MSSYHISILVVDKNNGKGKSGVKVTTNKSDNIKTDSSGYAHLEVSGSVAIFVDGQTIYDGFASACPTMIRVER